MKTSKIIAKYKIYLNRSRTYVSYIQLAMITKLFLSDTDVGSDWILVFGVVLCLVLLVFLGYLDTRFGIRSREAENNSFHNPVTMEILKTVKQIKNDKSTDSLR